jgi:hypothetical protein
MDSGLILEGRGRGMEPDAKRWLKVTVIAAAAVGVAGTVAALLVRDQIHRQQRNLFHPSALRRMAALEHVSRQKGSVDFLNLLRDYIAWEPRRLLRNRARVLMERMSEEVTGHAAAAPSRHAAMGHAPSGDVAS